MVRPLGLRLFFLRDGLCFGREFQAVGAQGGDGALAVLFTDSCPYAAHEAGLADIAHASRTAPVREADEALPLYPRGAMNLWHWVTESLPKLLAAESIGYSGKYILPAAAYADASSVIRQSLDLLGIAKERLLPSGPVWRVRTLVLAERLSGFHLAANLPLAALLREKLLSCAGVLSGGRRVYVRRIGRRRVANEDSVLALLREFDFKVMTPEDLTLAEQIRYMSNVDCSVMAHGANSALTLFQKPGSGAVELFGNRYVSYNNLHCARLLRLRYYPLVEDLGPASFPAGTVSTQDFFLRGMTADIQVDTLHLRIALEGML